METDKQMGKVNMLSQAVYGKVSVGSIVDSSF
jgi:hypothetical protein